MYADTGSGLSSRVFMRPLVIIALVLALILGATATASVLRQSPRIAEPSAPEDFRITLDQTQTVAGTTLHLTSAEFASDDTLLDFQVSWPDFDPATNLMPITFESLTVSGVSGDPTFFGTSKLDQSRDDAVQMTLAVGPPVPETTDIVVDISKIGLSDADGARWIDGPWTFTIPAKDVIQDPINVPIPVGKTVESGPVAITIASVHLSSRAVSVAYSVPAMPAGEAMPTSSVVQLVLPDGQVFNGVGRGGIQLREDSWVAYFPALPAGVDSFQLAFASFVTAVEQPVDVTFPIPDGFWNVTADATFAVGQTFDVDGETLVLDSLARSEPETGYDRTKPGEVAVIIRNTGEPGDRTITLGGPTPEGQTLTDDLGNSFVPIGGSMGTAEDGKGGLEAGESVSRFELPIDPGATTLTLHAESYGRVIPGPAPITIDVP